MKTLIEFKDVSFRYQEDGPWILKDCSFTIDHGESVAIIGHNGSGKSTIAKLMNGLLFPQKGEIWIHGRRLSEDTIWDIRRDVGMVFQNPDNQFVGTTVQDDVAFGMENRGMDRDVMEKRITESLEAVRMTTYRMTEPHRLSGGQKQRVAIAGVIAISPKLMILDEATVMLDPKGRVEIMDTVRRLRDREELTLLTITHHLEEIIALDKVIVLNHGQIWHIASPTEILKRGGELQQIGLNMPFIVALREELIKLGIPIKHHPLTINALLEELWRLHGIDH